MIAEFSYWKPADLNLRDVKANIIMVPPSQSDGRDEIEDPAWMEFAKKHKCALVGCFFQDDVPEGYVEDYCNVRVTGSGRELINFLKTGPYDKMAMPPLLLWGYSAGGQFNYEFACCYPHLVAGFVVNKGGVYYTLLAPGETRMLRGLFFVGRKDAKFRQNSIDAIYGLNKVAGARWALIEENTSHSLGNSEKVSRVFFENIITTL